MASLKLGNLSLNHLNVIIEYTRIMLKLMLPVLETFPCCSEVIINIISYDLFRLFQGKEKTPINF